MPETIQPVFVEVTVNGGKYQREVEPRLLLVELLREELGLTGTHIGCDTSYCGACTVLLDGRPVKSCTVLAVQADGRSIETVEGLEQEGKLHPLQEAFSEHHGLQCGFCTPGMLMSAKSLLADNPSPTRDEIKKAIAGNVCRCTGFQNIYVAVDAAAQKMRGG
ncbi:MAG: (2Fe-2S)-binding protein [Pseudomonadales bacterium]|jgi:carbon-monoxide dehydrogenase small subunit|nr:(2Fe-2S)-binding protein [Pseudomonadales bacterium]MCP5320435.1 (2Fe-2S)-binding protein [Pseudomonadales bacterium]MCP5336807.1 (2Fe-2S)-binding protein [Pseudomonadales bacterium]